jgi:LDH2 family malate/lactate/ureidoglycolate dehydrogenase
LQRIAEEILDELRNCPPAPGFERVEIPGEREREHREKTIDKGIALPQQTWQQIVDLSQRLACVKS